MIGLCERCLIKRIVRPLFYLEFQVIKGKKGNKTPISNRQSKLIPIMLCYDCETYAESKILVKYPSGRSARRTMRTILEQRDGGYYYIAGKNQGQRCAYV